MNSTVVKMTATKKLTINAMCIALTFVATAFINIRLPIMANGGLIHLGNVPLFLTAMIFRLDSMGTFYICYSGYYGVCCGKNFRKKQTTLVFYCNHSSIDNKNCRILYCRNDIIF